MKKKKILIFRENVLQSASLSFLGIK